MKKFLIKFGFENYIVFMGFLLLTIVTLYIWREITKFYAVTGIWQGYILVGFISFLLLIVIGMWIKNVRKEFKKKN